MFPFIKIWDITLWTFGITLSVSLLIFFWMLFKITKKIWININFFLSWFVFFFLFSFFFSRLFYVIAEWRDFWFIIQEPLHSMLAKFFLTSDYNMSLSWWVFWFFLALYIKTKKYHLSLEKYLDSIVISFMFAAIGWYLWAFVWWQVYGVPTTLPIWIDYNNINSTIPFSGKIFPLAIIYSIFSFFIFTYIYMLRIVTKKDWVSWYLWLFLFSIVIFIFEFFNWNVDIFELYIKFNINQIFFFVVAIISFKWYKQSKNLETTVEIL